MRSFLSDLLSCRAVGAVGAILIFSGREFFTGLAFRTAPRRRSIFEAFRIFRHCFFLARRMLRKPKTP
jgi:hypothetical protein